MQDVQGSDKTISEIVREDYRTADVFKKYGINYCCGGNTTLEEVCKLQNINTSVIQRELESMTKNVIIPSSIRFDEWEMDFLVDYIINVHHAYLKQTLPLLQTNLQSFVANHRKKYPFLDNVVEVYEELASLLQEHLEEEEIKVFPYIKQIYSTHRRKETYGRLFVKTLSKPLTQVLASDHKHIAALLLQLREVANGYRFAADACTNHQVVFQKLKELDADITQHEHLENNILYPKAINLERELLQL